MLTATFNAGIDSYMNGSSVDVNWGVSNFVRLGVKYLGGDKSELDRPIANFDVSSLAGATIAAARLKRDKTGGFGSAFGAHLYRCTRPSVWTESGVTWNKYDGSNAWTTAGGDFDLVTPAPISWTEAIVAGWETLEGLVDFVIDALANRAGVVSVIMKADAESPGSDALTEWYAKNYGSNVWYLEVDYNPAVSVPGRRARTGEGDMLAGSRGVGPRGGRLGVAPVGGVSPQRPLPAISEQRDGGE